MENDSGVNNNNNREVFSNGRVGNGKAVQVLQRSFDEVKGILERNRILIQEIEQSQQAREVGGLSRNVARVRELNSNMAHVLNRYSELSTAFSRGLARGCPATSAAYAAAASAASNMAYAVEYYSDLPTSSSLSLAKSSPTDTDVAKEG